MLARRGLAVGLAFAVLAACLTGPQRSPTAKAATAQASDPYAALLELEYPEAVARRLLEEAPVLASRIIRDRDLAVGVSRGLAIYPEELDLDFRESSWTSRGSIHFSTDGTTAAKYALDYHPQNDGEERWSDLRRELKKSQRNDYGVLMSLALPRSWLPSHINGQTIDVRLDGANHALFLEHIVIARIPHNEKYRTFLENGALDYFDQDHPLSLAEYRARYAPGGKISPARPPKRPGGRRALEKSSR